MYVMSLRQTEKEVEGEERRKKGGREEERRGRDSWDS